MSRTAREERTLARVLEMYQRVLIDMNDELIDQYFSPDYIQHSSLAEPGLPALRGFLQRVRRETPAARQDIRRAFVDGDHVVVHTHVRLRPEDRGFVAADIFRVDADDRIVEHWDVIQDIPANGPNPNPMI